MQILREEKEAERKEGTASGGNDNVQKNVGGKEQVMCRRLQN